jgi:hypothetical protein
MPHRELREFAMTTTTVPVAGTLPTSRGRTAARVAAAGLAAGTAGAAALYAYGAALAVTSLPMRAGDPWAASAEPVTPANFAGGVVLCTFWGTVLAVVLALTVHRPAQTFLRTAVALVVLSLFAPLGAVDTAVSTKLALAAGHLLAAAVVVPLLARALPTRR